MNKQSSKVLERKGTWYAILSGLFYALLGYFGIRLLDTGLPPIAISFWRFFIAFLFLLLVFIIKSKDQLPSFKRCLSIIFTGGLFYSIPGILFLISSRHIGTGQAMVIFFIFPIFVMALNWMFLKQPIKSSYFISFTVTLCGLLLLVDMQRLSFNFIGIGLNVIAALSYALYIFTSKDKKDKIKNVSPLLSSLLVAFGCTVNCGALALITDSFAWPVEASQWVNMLGLGIVCSALPILFLFGALKLISSAKASLLSVLEPVFGVTFGVFLLDETLSFRAFFGIALILLGTLFITIDWKAISLWRFKNGLSPIKNTDVKS